MASLLGREAFTVQESVNSKAFTDWNYEELSFYSAGEGVSDISTYITEANPAKKIVLYQLPSNDGRLLEDTNAITMTINGTGSPHLIKIDSGELPFTINGIIVTSLSVAISGSASGDKISVLSFH